MLDYLGLRSPPSSSPKHSAYSTFQQKEAHFDSTWGPRIQKKQVFFEKALFLWRAISLQTSAFQSGFPSHPSPPFAHVSDQGGLGWAGVGDWRKAPFLESLGGGEFFLFFFSLGFVFVLFVLFLFCFCFVVGLVLVFFLFLFCQGFFICLLLVLLFVLVCFVCLCWSVFVVFMFSCCVFGVYVCFVLCVCWTGLGVVLVLLCLVCFVCVSFLFLRACFFLSLMKITVLLANQVFWV